MAASYGGPYAGNFMPSLIAYDAVAKELGYRTVYLFPDFTANYAWVEEMRRIADKVYFIAYHPYSLDNVKRIRRICREEQAVLLYSRMSGWDLTARLAMPRLPQLWHMEMGLDLSSRKRKFKYRFKYRVLGFGKTYHIAVSEPTTETINSLHVSNRCVWIPNAIDLTRLHEREAYSFGDPVKLLSFAYQPSIKGFDLALDACEALNREGVRFLLFASAQERTFEYVKERYGNAAPEWLTLLAPTDRIASVYDSVDVMLAPSRSEGFSFALTEALYSGLAVVYSDIPGSRWADELQMAFRFRSEDAQSLAKAIETCVKEPVTAQKQRFNRALIQEKYTLTAWQNKLRTVLQQLLPEE